MQIFINVNNDNRVIGWGSTRGNESDIEVTVSENHEFLNNPFIFTYSNGNLVKDEVYQQELLAQKEAETNGLTKLEEIMVALAELAEAFEQKKTNTQLAIVELAEIKGGV
ncbi:hypothetical protein [Peribacillus frigoritolerans]|uniref:hypothetical protein n=1 Tax=Peribacillus castrilensis TaxID=2897690 RepID=UPI003D29F1AF